jgi:hypothetical protein
MRHSKLTIALGLAMAAGAAQAAGPLFLTEGTDPQPLRWDTSGGPIPVWTDGGDVFTYDFDGVTPFITVERADEITAFAFEQWSNVPSSTFSAEIAGTIESQTGIDDVTGANADQIYFVENGYGFWVLYDTDGSILSDYFGVPSSVLGIAFPEFADENGNIIEATAVMNGFAVRANDPNGDQFAGVFTHEFGHAINLAHTQTNGQIAYFSSAFAPLYPGVKDCGPFPTLSDPEDIETMYPFLDPGGIRGVAQSTVNHPDDVASISDLYPAPGYAASTGSISGVLRLKDGKTEFSGINVVARNVDDLYGDAVSGLTGDLTQGQIGPDGRYTINNLVPGEQYVVYIEQIRAGGYSTTPRRLVSTAEYWNDAESNDPATDGVCDATPILAEAGVTKQADITFNGYLKGIQYTPIVDAFLVDLAKNGRKSAGQAGSTAFVWDQNKDFIVLPPSIKTATGTSIFTRNGQKMLVQYDFSGNGIQQGAIFDFQGSKKGGLVSLGDLNGDTCGGSSSTGVSSSAAWAIDDAGQTAVGLAYVDKDGDGNCQRSFVGEILPFIWDARNGIRELDTSGLGFTPQFVRAHAISGDGSVVLGAAGGSNAVAWLDEGPIIDLRAEFGGRDAYATSYDGSRVAIGTSSDGVVLWNPKTGESETIGGLRWCRDLDFVRFGTNFCELLGEEAVNEALGPIPVLPSDMTDDGSVLVGRAGSFFTGFVGGMWIEDIGWINLRDFFRKQGVAEAFDLPMDNPISISASGKEMVGGLAGAQTSWLVEMDQVYVCQDGQSVQTGFPNGLRAKMAEGALFGRCEFLED